QFNQGGAVIRVLLILREVFADGLQDLVRLFREDLDDFVVDQLLVHFLGGGGVGSHVGRQRLVGRGGFGGLGALHGGFAQGVAQGLDTLLGHFENGVVIATAFGQ